MEKEIATDDDAHEHVKSAAPTAVSYGWPAGMKGKPKLIKRDNTINPKVIQNAAKDLQVVVKNAMVESGEKEKVFSLTYSVLQKTVPLRNVESAGESGEKQSESALHIKRRRGGEGMLVIMLLLTAKLQSISAIEHHGPSGVDWLKYVARGGVVGRLFCRSRCLRRRICARRCKICVLTFIFAYIRICFFYVCVSFRCR